MAEPEQNQDSTGRAVANGPSKFERLPDVQNAYHEHSNHMGDGMARETS